MSRNAGNASGGDTLSSSQAMKSFQSPDAILEPDIMQQLTDYMKDGGQPLLLVNALSSSYVGMPDMCNLMAGWATEFDIDPVEVMQEALKEQLMGKFDPEGVDKAFMSGSERPEWLSPMIQHPFWRSVIYELSEQHKKCNLLNYAIQRISDAGYQGEIASVATASTFLKVFSGVLLDSLDKLREEDDVGLLDRLPDLVKVCCQSEHTYLFTQVLLFRLMKTDRGLPLKRISKELESGVLEKFNRPPLVAILRMLLAGASSNVASAISVILQSRIPSPGDVMLLHRAYSSDDPPSTYFLRDPDFFEIMLSSIFVPSFKGGVVKQDHKEKYLWLIAYAASVQEEDERITDTSEVQPTYEALCALEDTLSKRTAGTDLTPILKNLLIAIETPVASMALLYWIQFVIRETSYIETYFRSHEVPVPLLLIEEMTYRKSILDRMIYLIQLNYAMPVLDYIQVRARKMDQSLSMHFVKKVLEMVRGPYSKKFIEGMSQMIEEIVEVIKKTDTEPVVRAWLDEVASQPDDFEMATPPSALEAPDAWLTTVMDLKRRLDETRR
ncbi:Negative elongation factor C/D [Podila minutissima]|uniref:Negative elongation factor C/D n=1 Tax=Podila minutissima TaxID=64525 RepID=A0A9P5SLY0_9FUNG|nr:Negative elongation factor C/D [Podila minutissima]